MQLAHEWLVRCESNHTECIQKDINHFKYPMRLIDITDQAQRLITLDMSSDTDVHYVALSHCWGTAQPLKTCRENIDRHITYGMSQTELPATFRDAIQVSRNLGFKYIWIDSVCIIQDDHRDWEEQSSQMASVYSNADLVLAAASSSSADEGFLGHNRLTRESSVEIPSQSDNGQLLRLKYRLGPPLHMENDAFIDPLDGDPLDMRGWALQERLLARRYLAFGRRELSWTCMESTHCECSCSEFRPDYRPAVDNIRKAKAAARYFTGSKGANIGQYWRDKVLTPYSRRFLTKPTDKLIALTAAASQLQSEFGVTYLAGLWKEDLILELLWYVAHFRVAIDRPSMRQENFYAPTWSWVSVDAPMSWHPFSSNQNIQEPLARVLEAFTHPSTINPFGPVSAGHIKLEAIAQPAVARYDHAQGEWRVCMPEIDESFSQVRFDTPLRITPSKEKGAQMERISVKRLRQGEKEGIQVSEIAVTAVPLLLAKYSWKEDWYIEGLILQESLTRVGVFERLGYFYLQNFHNDSHIRMMERREIDII
ncbi:hypothetical protein N8I77_003340 [Diaporthe amygdali]|uniref:Heterokaryon incompatibility domain-containing protein n=1 Tax=Phomopsis amygdali TaxID=1214568 RepID=A0AAD9W6N2_PHOAM|nr:hypothetical protein N8I77_003340 [Diaporthe amygdali]